MERFSYSQPADMRGVEDFFPPEMRGAITELIRRDEQRMTGLINAIRNQVIVDENLLPSQTSGASETTSEEIATNLDTETSEIIGILWK